MPRGNIFSVYAMIVFLLLSLVVFAFMIVPQGPEKQPDRQVTVIRYDSQEDAKKGLAEHLGIMVEELERQDRSNLDYKEEEE